MKSVTKHTGRFVQIRAKQYLNCSTTSYLNIPYESQFQAWTIEGIQQFGTGYGSSPLSKPVLSVYEELERELASCYGAEAAILFPTGFTATQAIVNMLAETYNIIYGDIIHPALIANHKATGKENSVFVSDFISPITLKQVTKQALQSAKTYLIDASHAFGIFDEELRNLIREGGVIAGSLNKAFGIPAGVVLCTQPMKSELQQKMNYQTASPPAPATCYALLKALQTGWLTQQQEKLFALCAFAKQQGIALQTQLPVYLPKVQTDAYFNHFYNNGVLIWRNEYPKASQQQINRIVLHAGLQRIDIEQIARLLKKQ